MGPHVMSSWNLMNLHEFSQPSSRKDQPSKNNLSSCEIHESSVIRFPYVNDEGKGAVKER